MKRTKQNDDNFIMLPTVDFCFKELMRNPKVRKGFIAAVRIHPVGGFSLYDRRHIAELLSLDIYKQACISNTINSYCMADC